jgi:exosome complex RNA-binding protein Rrp42 (RNase PH superfamily)
MKQQICESERAFIVHGFKYSMRSDGRSNTDSRVFSVKQGTIVEAFGSATLQFGEHDTEIVVAIKAEVLKPLASEPNAG